MEQYIPLATSLALDAGAEILRIYRSEITVEWKEDLSPLTEADRRAHKIIQNGLSATGIPVLSEEGERIGYPERHRWKRFWLVDPLDGTRQFISRSGDFTVNIALIEDGRPILGVIYAPLGDVLYYGAEATGSFKIGNARRLYRQGNWHAMSAASEQLPLPQDEPHNYAIVAAQYMAGPETEAFIASKRRQYKQVETRSVGSSLKICLVAEGTADVYPRLAPTMEWDTAAGHAIARFAGCRIYDHETQSELVYNKENLRNPWFIVDRPVLAAVAS